MKNLHLLLLIVLLLSACSGPTSPQAFPSQTQTSITTTTSPANLQLALNLAPCPYYDMCPGALFINTLIPGELEPGRVENVDVPYDRPVSFYIGWIARDHTILAQNMNNMQFFFMIDGRNYWDDAYMGMPGAYVYEDEPNTEYASQGAGVEISGWKIDQPHEIRLGYSINAEINDGWDTYASGTVIEHIFMINPIFTALETSTATGNPPTASPEIPVTGKIEGKVYRSDPDQPIANVTVILIREAGTGTFEEKIVSVTATDLNGNYSLSGVQPASYTLWISLEKIPEFANYPFCSDNVPEDWIAYLTGYSAIPIALLPPNMEFSVVAGDGLIKDIDMAVIQCNLP